MDRDKNNLWHRRSNAGRMPSATTGDDHDSRDSPSTRPFTRRHGGDSYRSRADPLNALPPLSTTGIASPSAGAHSAFGLGSGAFASFGSATTAKTPKTPGTTMDTSKSTTYDKKEDVGRRTSSTSARISTSSSVAAASGSGVLDWDPGHLKYSWVIWYRPPTSKNSDYEKSTKPMCRMATAQDFWKIYIRLRRPSALPVVSDYHFFREGIRPVWEDEENKRGGKWIMRLKKNVCDRYWENLLLAMIGDEFAEAGEEVCGAVLSVKPSEDVMSVWTKNDGGRNVKIRETIKRVLDLPVDTNIQWRSHDESIAQRTALEQARQEKTSHYGEKRRGTLSHEDRDRDREGETGKGRSFGA